MATLNSSELTTIRQEIARKHDVTWTKPCINAAAQAVEDLITNNAVAISNAINAATQPYGVTLTVSQKTLLVAWVLFTKYARDK